MLAAPAAALAQGNAVEMKATTRVLAGQGDPTVTFMGGADGHIDVELRCGARRYGLSEDISPGSSHALPLTTLAVGSHECTGALSLRTADGGTGEMPLAMSVAVLPMLKLSVDKAELDLEGRSLVLRADRAVADISVVVYGEGGEIGGGQQAGDGTESLVRWDSAGEILKIEVTAADADGFRSKLTLLPWSYQIPHEDVVFATNDAGIAASEVSKLEAAWGHIEATMAKYGDIVDMELYVAGCTDTVGDAGSNRALSLRRARAIAAWFRERGFQGPVYIQGLGESALAVQTADGVDEARNRRALYILSAEAPAVSEALPSARWEAL